MLIYTILHEKSCCYLLKITMKNASQSGKMDEILELGERNLKFSFVLQHCTYITWKMHSFSANQPQVIFMHIIRYFNITVTFHSSPALILACILTACPWPCSCRLSYDLILCNEVMSPLKDSTLKCLIQRYLKSLASVILWFLITCSLDKTAAKKAPK